MKRFSPHGAVRTAWAIMALALLAPAPGRADALAGYSIQVLAQLNHTVGDFSPRNYLAVQRLNDKGQIALLTSNNAARSELVQNSDGKATTVALAGGPAPDGKTWPSNLGFASLSMNEAGDIAFMPADSGGNPLGVYLWDAAKQSVTRVALPGTPVGNNVSLLDWGNIGGADLNNHGDIAFVGWVKLADGKRNSAIFLYHPDGRIEPVALPGDSLPGQGGKVVLAGDPTLDDAGRVGFTAGGTDLQFTHPYLWENGTVSLIADPGTPIAGFGPPIGAQIWRLNNKDQTALFQGAMWDPNAAGQALWGLFLWKDGQFISVTVPGQAMPGGGTFTGKSAPADVGVPNELGQIAFVLPVNESGVTHNGAYWVDTSGLLTLIAKTGMTTELGTITGIDTANASGIGLNSQGQVVLAAQIDKGPASLLLLTPKAR